MCATFNSKTVCQTVKRLLPGQTKGFPVAARFFRAVALAGWLFASLGLLSATAGPAPTGTNFVTRAEERFRQARQRYQTETNNSEVAWQFALACFDYADLATNKATRVEIAGQGIAACRQLIARHPASAPGHYYLGMNLGQVADTKRNLAALRMAKEMEREFLLVCDLDEHLDHAGADRNLGLLYLEAPSLISIGSRTRARQRLRRTVELEPDFPENRLVLAEAYLKWGETADARRELKALEALWPEAQRKFNGEDWTVIWRDWEKRLQNIKDKLRDPSTKVLLPHYGD